MDLQEALKTISVYTSEFPADAISVIRENKDDAVDGLIDIIKQPLEMNKDEETDLDAAVAALILSEFKEKRAFEYFIKYIYEGDDFCDIFLGDVYWEYFPCILANTISADKVDDLKKSCEVSNDNWFMMSVLAEAFLMICAKNIISYDEFVEYIEYIIEKYSDSESVATVIASNVRYIYSEKIEKFVINAFENKNVDLTVLSRMDAEENMSFAKDKDASERVNDYIKDHPDYVTAECIESWYKNNENFKGSTSLNPGVIYDIYAIAGEPEYDLRKVLSLYNSTMIRKILHFYNVEEEWKYSRSQIEDIIFNKITYYDDFVYNMNHIDEKSFQRFCKFIKKEQYSLFLYDKDIFNDFVLCGFLTLFKYNGKFYVSVCKEVRELYNKYMENDERKKYNLCIELDAYAQSAVNLYGVITLNKFYEIFNNYNKVNYAHEYICELLKLLDMNEGGYYLDGEFLVNYIFKDNFKPYFLAELKEKAKNTEEMYLPSKNMFLKYYNLDYFVSSIEYRNMARFIYSICDDMDDIEDIEDRKDTAINITNEIYFFAMGLSDYNDYTSLLSAFHISMFDKEDKFLSLYKKFDMSVRKWVNKGFRDLDIKPSEVLPGKVGRNDPCPCGSGKKYKKCCGK